MKKTVLFFLIFFILFFALFFFNKSRENSIPYGFYYWKHKYEVSTQTQKYPKYIKILDIYYSKKLYIQETLFSNKIEHKIVPVIYMDNGLFYHLTGKDLAKKVYEHLEKLSLKYFSYKEIQIDCDWTLKTKEQYFSFIQELKKHSNKLLSSTIRLHQVKYYHKTGVPPVDKGVLMYYNMSDFKDLKTKNYILDLDIAKKYHKNFDNYPLPLDLALPLYAQATLIRFGEVKGIIEGLRKKDLSTNFTQTKENLYRANKTHYIKGRLLYKGDMLRLDSVSKEVLKEAVHNLKKIMKEPKEILFYRWGNRDFYEEKNFREICSW